MKTMITALALLTLAAGPVFAASSPSFQQAQLADCYLGSQFIWVPRT
jgi:hypothetical protein